MTEALRSTGVIHRATVTRVEPTVIGVGSGLVGQVARVSLSYDSEELGAPASLVAKFPAAGEAGRAIGNTFDLYHREIRFYREIAAEIELRTPAHYYSAVNPDSREYILLIEDLAPLQVGDHAVGCTPEEARLAIESIGKFHATWWESPRLQAIGDWMPALDAPVQRLGSAAYQRAWGPFLEMFGDGLSPEVKAVGEALGRKIVEIQSSLASSPVTINHGDFRADNLFFSSAKGDTPFAVIDWQVSTIGRGTFDVAYLLCGGLEPELRRQHERELVETYHRTLEANGVKGYGFERCWADYRLGALFHFVYIVIIVGTLDPANERGMALFRAWLRRGAAALEELRAVEQMPT
jgi:hypothetical protein